MPCVSDSSNNPTCSSITDKTKCNDTTDCVWMNQEESTALIIALVLIFILYLVALVFLSTWISKKLQIEGAIVVVLGIFCPPIWLFLLLWAAVRHQDGPSAATTEGQPLQNGAQQPPALQEY